MANPLQSFGEELGNAAHAAVQDINSVNGSRVSNLDKAIQAGAHEAVYDFKIVQGEVPGVGEELAARSLGIMHTINFGITVLNYFYALAAARSIAIGITYRMPNWIGRPARHYIDFIVKSIPSVMTEGIDQANFNIPGVGAAWVNFLDWIMPATQTIRAIKNGSTGKTLTVPQIEHQIYEIKLTDLRLQREINALNAKIGQINVTQTPTGVLPLPTTPPAPVISVSTIDDQIHELQHEWADLKSTVHAQGDVIGQIENALDIAQQEINDLKKNLHGIDVTVEGWPAIRAQLLDQVTAIGQTLDTVETGLARQTDRVTALEPLSLLLQPGAKGLKTLRQLEDTPCMCPKFQGLDGAFGTALAVYEFLSNG